MDSNATRILVVCTLGTLLGLGIAFQLPSLIWWLAAPIGAVIAGALYASPEIVRFAPLAAEKALVGLNYPPKIPEAVAAHFRSIRNSSQAEKWFAASWAMLAVKYILVIILLLVIPVEELKGSPDMVYTSLLVIGILSYYLPLGIIIKYRVSQARKESSEEHLRNARRTFFLTNPVGFLIYLVRVILSITPTVLRAIYQSSIFLARFLVQLFTLVHSKILTIVLVDTTFSILFTYILLVRIFDLQPGPTLLLGGILGGLIGVVNYEIVSKRILRIAH